MRTVKLVLTLYICAAISLSTSYSVWADGSSNPQEPSKIEVSAALRLAQEQTHELEKRFRTQIAHDEKSQPDWDSAPIKAALDKAVKAVDSSQDADLSAYRSLLVLSCQTPLLDVELVRIASDMFSALRPWMRARNILWVRSGRDMSVFLPNIPRDCRRFEDWLVEEQRSRKIAEINPMVSLAHHCTVEIDKGDTLSATRDLGQLLKLAEKSGDYELTAHVLDWYKDFLDVTHYRRSPNTQPYDSKLDYVWREAQCMKADADFAAALNRLRPNCRPEVVQQLRDAQSDLIEHRRSQDFTGIIERYKKLVELADKSGDRSSALPYFALCTYHAYLSQDHSTKRDYNKLRKELFLSWVSEELGKQPLIVSDHVAAGGDWKRMEAVFDALEKQNIFVCRNVHLCRMWGESYRSSLLHWNPNTGLIGIVYYEWPNSRPDLFLECHARSEPKHWPSCGEIRAVENEREPIVAALTKSLTDAGFKATTTNHPNIVRVAGDWHELDY